MKDDKKRLSVNVRDVTESRETWRTRAEAEAKHAKDLEAEVMALKRQVADLKKGLPLAGNDTKQAEPPLGIHGYGAECITYFTQLVLNAGVSLQGAARVMGLHKTTRRRIGRPDVSGSSNWDTPS